MIKIISFRRLLNWYEQIDKKLIRRIRTIIYIAIALYLYSVINFVPFGSIIAKEKIENYLEQVYGGSGGKITPMYDVLNSNYDVHVSSLDRKIRIDLHHNKIDDESVMEDFEKEFQHDFRNLQQSQVGNIELKHAYLYTSIVANGRYSKDIYKLKTSQKLYLSVMNRNKIPENESKKNAAKITKDVIDKLGNKYNINSLQVIYTDKNGLFEIIIRDEKTITERKLLRHTSKMDRIGSEDENLLRELNK
ncbi:MAG: hypothetical protein K0S51_1235 [Bacillales bacterium]|nr:hypothetical protein [Bacillales bacterium]